MATGMSLAAGHLMLRLRPLNRALRNAVEKLQTASKRLNRPDLSALCVTDEQIQILLNDVDAQSGAAIAVGPAMLSDDEQRMEEKLRQQSRAQGKVLPLDQLADAKHLTAFDSEAVLLCAAPELDRNYERIFAFVLDDLNRRFPCVELLISLSSSSTGERLKRRIELGSSGTLRRLGILVPVGQSHTELRHEFRLGPGIFDYLIGAEPGLALLYRDDAEIAVPNNIAYPPQIEAERFQHLVAMIESRQASIVAVWSSLQDAPNDLALALAAALHRPLRQISLNEMEQQGADPANLLREQIRIATALGSLLWLRTNRLSEQIRERIQHVLAEALAHCPVPIVITGEYRWRDERLLRSGGYVELELSAASFKQREQLWSRSFPELDAAEVTDLAARFSLGGDDIDSISKLAHTRAHLEGNGVPDPVRNHVLAACNVVTRRATSHFTTTVMAKHGLDDLILRPDLHNQVREVATFFRLRQKIDEDWGFGHLAGGNGGMKALFTGEPGTGKTLGAEVIAGLLSVPLCKVDLARVVSKWVGETERNLECAFREAEESHSVLFFDEAEALFGKRADVQHGTDRYANLEISYLLQRLEASSGLVILASNLKDQIDAAFIRRFQVVIHFPRPGLAERLRMWGMAFPKAAPLDAELDLPALARLDMNGAAIMGTARTAALLAADVGSTITMSLVLQATARQYRREARVLSAADLGPYGALLQGAP